MIFAKSHIQPVRELRRGPRHPHEQPHAEDHRYQAMAPLRDEKIGHSCMVRKRDILPEITPHGAYTHMQCVRRTNLCGRPWRRPVDGCRSSTSNRENKGHSSNSVPTWGAAFQLILTHGHLTTSWLSVAQRHVRSVAAHAPFGPGHLRSGTHRGADVWGVHIRFEVVLDLEAGQTVHCGQAELSALGSWTYAGSRGLRLP